MPTKEDKKTPLYVGANRIVEYNLSEEGKVTCKLEDGQIHTVTQSQFEQMAKTEPYDDAMVRVHKWKPAVRRMMEILLDEDMTLLEKDFVVGRLDETITSNYAKASAKIFGAKDGFEGNISLSQIDKVLKS